MNEAHLKYTVHIHCSLLVHRVRTCSEGKRCPDEYSVKIILCPTHSKATALDYFIVQLDGDESDVHTPCLPWRGNVVGERLQRHPLEKIRNILRKKREQNARINISSRVNPFISVFSETSKRCVFLASHRLSPVKALGG